MKKLAAVILETRVVPNLVEIIRDKHMKFLPEDTQLIIFHSDENYEVLKEAFPVAGFSNITALRSLNDYNYVLTRPEFWKQLEEFFRVLIFQSDSEILRTGVEEFLRDDVDFCGAPWIWDKGYNSGNNGGFSIRNPRIMEEICRSYPWNGSLNEDHWFGIQMRDIGIGRLAPRELADAFSCETIFKLGTFGQHAVDKWLTTEECIIIKNQYK